MRETVFLGSVRKRMAGLVCPGCGSANEGATMVNDRPGLKTVKPGDLGMCAYCGVLVRYVEAPASPSGLTMRALSAEEWAMIRRDPRLKKLTDAARHGRRPPPERVK